MRRLFQIISFFAFVIAPVVADEPVAKEKPVGVLVKQLGDTDPEKVSAAAKALGKLGTAKEAGPALNELLKSRNGRVKWSAAEALWLLEHDAATAVPTFSELLTAAEADVRAASAWRLGRLGSDARPAVLPLAAALRDENLEVRIQAGQALANLGPAAVAALPALVRALGDERLDEHAHDQKERANIRNSPAFPAIIAMGDDAIPQLIETFQIRPADVTVGGSDEARAAEAALRVTLVFPALGRRAEAPLLQALESEKAHTRRYAALALREVAQFNKLSQAAAENLAKHLDDEDEGVRTAAARAIVWAEPSNAKAVVVLERASKNHAISKRNLLADLEQMTPHNDDAVTLLFGLLSDKGADTAQEAHRILASLELPAERVLPVWIKALSHSDLKVRSEAIAALEKLGPSARTAKPALYKQSEKEGDHYAKGGILNALTAIDPEDPKLVPFLIKLIDDPEDWVRWRAINNLGKLGPKAMGALPTIEARFLNTTQKGNPHTYLDGYMKYLVEAIVRIAPNSAASATTLLKALRDPNIRAMHGAKNMWYMRDLLEDALQANLPEATAVLREALKDKDEEVRTSAALVLVRAGLDVDTALPVLMKDLWTDANRYDEKPRFQTHVVETLMRRQPSVTPAVATAWSKAWKSAASEQRETLEWGMRVLQAECLPHLLEQLRQAKTVQARRDLAHLLVHFDGQCKLVVPILREELRDRRLDNQHAAMEALEILGPDAADAIPELVQLLHSREPGMRFVAARVLGKIGSRARDSMPELKKMLKEDNSVTRLAAASAISRIDPDNREAIILLRDELVAEKKDWMSLGSSVELRLSRLSISFRPEDPETCIPRFGAHAVPVLAELLDNVDLDEWSTDNISSQCGSNARIQAALCLAKIGPEAKAALPALIRALKDRDPFVRDAAASAIGRIGTAAKEAAPEFIRLIEEQNRNAGAGTWSSSSVAGGRFDRSRSEAYGGRFENRSAGRGEILERRERGRYDYDYRVPYADITPDFPFDPINVLSQIDRETRSAQPILSEIAKNPNHPARLAAALALWRSGSESPELIPAFTAALEASSKSEGHAFSPELRACLTELGLQLKPTIGPLTDWLKNRRSYSDLDNEITVVDSLGCLGPEAHQALELIRPFLQGDEWEAKRRVAAALALFRICGETDVAFPVLCEVIVGKEERGSFYSRTDWTKTARVMAAQALGELAEHGDKRARAVLVETAKGDENEHVRNAARDSLTRQTQASRN